MQSNLRADLEKWSARAILTISLAIILWFAVSEVDGLVRLAEYLWSAVTIVPDSIGTIVTYYSDLPFDQLAPSLITGALFGGVTTFVWLIFTHHPFKLPPLAMSAILAGLFIGVVGYSVGLIFLNAVALGVSAAMVVSLAIQPELREGLRHAQPLSLVNRQNGVRTGIWFSLGSGVGMLGSQLLTYPTQHCTYLPDAAIAERQLGFVITLAGIIVFLLPLWTLLLQRNSQRNSAKAGSFRGQTLPALFLLPTIVSLVVFLYYPAIEILITSLVQSNARIPGRQNFVCLGNYIDLVQDTTYQNSFVTTLGLTFWVVVLSITVALGIALLASQKLRYAYVYRTLLIWPFALSPVVAGVIFFTMFQQDSGLINYVLNELFGIRPEWRSDANLARIMIVFASVWNILGFNVLFYIAGLQNIPKDLLEAAEIDGASSLQRFVRITFPLLSPFTFFLLITNVTYSFYGIYGVIDVLTQGGPQFGEGGANGATEVLIYRLYEGGSQAGLAGAQALILFVMIAAITIFQFGYIERRVTYAN